MAIIYKITNDINNKVYVGKTTRDLDTRFNEHKKPKNGKSKSAIRDAIQKYGSEHFQIELIEECEYDRLNERERYWISYYDSYQQGYNLTTGGDGIALSEEKIKTIRDLWLNGETIVSIANILELPHSTVYHRIAQYEDFDPIENKQRALVPQEKPIIQYDINGNILKRYRSINEAERETKISAKQIGAARKNGTQCHGYYWQFENEELKISSNKKRVYQYTLDLKLVKEYAGAREAAREFGADSASIIKCCNGKQKTCKGYVFKYEKID